MSQKRKPQAVYPSMFVILLCAGVLLLLFLLAMLFISPVQVEQDGGEATLPPSPSQAHADGAYDTHVALRVLVENTVEEMDMRDYLYRVVAAEMPASFELEALKAQAVAARTYTFVKMQVQTPRHPDADVCSDITCCQAYIAPEAAAESWGEGAAGYEEKIKTAVLDTDGMTALYEHAPIDAVFHSSSVGTTLDAVHVWGADVPYLKSVSSPEGAEVPNYENDVTFTLDQARAIALSTYPEMHLTQDSTQWFSNWRLLSNGTVDSVEFGGVTLRGTQVRSLFGLRSATFTVSLTESLITFHVTGYGHAVGMSQYGANALAKEGKSYDEIIRWYYTGVSVEVWSPET